jgi:hypothetical protein
MKGCYSKCELGVTFLDTSTASHLAKFVLAHPQLPPKISLRSRKVCATYTKLLTLPGFLRRILRLDSSQLSTVAVSSRHLHLHLHPISIVNLIPARSAGTFVIGFLATLDKLENTTTTATTLNDDWIAVVQ